MLNKLPVVAYIVSVLTAFDLSTIYAVLVIVICLFIFFASPKSIREKFAGECDKNTTDPSHLCF